MNYNEAMIYLYKGAKIKLPEWDGNWSYDKSTEQILVETGAGEILSTPYLDDYTKRTDWQMTDGSRTFGGALRALEAGKSVRLPHWGHDVFISLQKTDEHSKMTHNYLYVTSRFGLVPWNPTQPELLSKQWIIIN